LITARPDSFSYAETKSAPSRGGEGTTNDQAGMKFLKWLGIVALVTVPLAVILNKKEERYEKEKAPEADDSDDIFAAELRD
jgi:hypothetical protein